MNKTLKIILNILIGIAALGCLVFFIEYAGSVTYAHREIEDPSISAMQVFDYEVSHKAYGELVSGYFSDRISDFDAPAGEEILYATAEYANRSFLSKAYEEQGNAEKIASCEAKKAELREKLGDYDFAADEIDAILN